MGKEFSLSRFIVFYLEEGGIIFRERSVASYLQPEPSGSYNHGICFHSSKWIYSEKRGWEGIGGGEF